MGAAHTSRKPLPDKHRLQSLEKQADLSRSVDTACRVSMHDNTAENNCPGPELMNLQKI